MPKLCIMYLTDALRPYAFPKFIESLSNCKYISEIIVLVLTHDPNLQYLHSLLSDSSIQYRLAQVEPDRNYLRKIHLTLEFMTQENIPYLMKHDNDIIMSSHMYDTLFENLDVLENPKNLLLTPTLTSGIPTCDMFLEDYLTKDEQKEMGDLFLQYEHGPLWGTDYTALNTFTKGAKQWNAAEYYAGVKAHPHHYKGIHPVRMSKDAIFKLNEFVLRHKEAILSKSNYTLHYDNTSPYFCNSIFCIKASVYATIVNRHDLYVDNYDEVPLNKWRDMHSLNLVIIRNGAAIHPFYNTIDNYILYEKAFCDVISSTDKHQ